MSEDVGEPDTAHLEAVFEQSKRSPRSQVALKEGRMEMREKINAGMARVEESYGSLNNGISKLKVETVHSEGNKKVLVIQCLRV